MRLYGNMPLINKDKNTLLKFLVSVLLLIYCYLFVNHFTHQGALFVLQSTRVQYLITHYWEVMVEVWPMIVRADHSEKPSIVTLINKLTGRVTKADSIGLERKVSHNFFQLFSCACFLDK